MGILENHNWYYNEVGHELKLQVNVDGVPIFKSTRLNFWPILVKLGPFPPFVVAIFSGNYKPNNVDEYLEDFVNEMRVLQRDNFRYRDKTLHCQVLVLRLRCSRKVLYEEDHQM